VSVRLIGGPLDGERREWPLGRRECVFPTASIVALYGVRFTNDHGDPEPLVIDRATYRLSVIPIGDGLGIARHVA
jgi:hypothetical protein